MTNTFGLKELDAIQDAVTLAQDYQLTTAITHTEVELAYVRQLLKHRGGNDPRLVTDELEVLARLGDLKRQAAGL